MYRHCTEPSVFKDITVSSKSQGQISRQVITANGIYAVMDMCTAKSLREDLMGV